MILQALNQYYQRLQEDPEKSVPAFGYGVQRFGFALLLDSGGTLLQVMDLREKREKNKLYPIYLTVPQELNERSGSKIAPHFMWDNTMYVLGNDNKAKPKRSQDALDVLGNDNKAKSKRSQDAFESFKAFHHDLCDSSNDPGIQAVLTFLDNWNPKEAPKLEHWEDMAGMNLAFMLEQGGTPEFIHDRPAVQEIWARYLRIDQGESLGHCLISGQSAPIARLHPAIKGVQGAQTKGAAIVSFNLDAFTSYGKEQSYNAPVSEQAVFGYTTALNRLLAYDSPQKVRIAETTTVFWTERDSALEGFMGVLLDPGNDSDDVQELGLFLQAIRDGKMPDQFDDDPDMKFYILGLSPNASRLAVRFWLSSTVEAVREKILLHFDDLAIVKQFKNDPDYPAAWQLLRETAAQRDSRNIPPLLAGGLMRAMLSGLPYPRGFLSAILTRIRADQTVNYIRAAIIKACLNRYHRVNPQQITEVSMSLDKESTKPAYRLGRLFAVLEYAQAEAVSGAKATIKDRYYGAASATPRAVIPQLLRLAQHHIQKIKKEKEGKAHWIEKWIEEIFQGMDSEGLKAHLNIEEQGFFALGYYHQKAALYQKRQKKEGSEED